MGKPSDHGVTWSPFAAAAPAPLVGLDHLAGQYGTIRLESLPGDDEAEFVEAAEGSQVGAGERISAPVDGSVVHVEVFRAECVGALILRRPRPLSGHRRAGPPRDVRYTLIWEEPMKLDGEDAEEFRIKLNHFCRAYSFLSQVMAFIDPSLERLYLYGKLLLTQLPTGEHDPMPQLGKEVLLTHLRMSATGETDIQLEAGDQTPGTALPGEGLGSKTEPVTDKLSALIEVMNEKFGADLDESDKLVFEQTHMDIMRRDDLRIIAKGNDREHYQLALTDVVDDIFLSRGNRNAQIVEDYYAHPEIRDAFIDFVSDTWKEFRAEHE